MGYEFQDFSKALKGANSAEGDWENLRNEPRLLTIYRVARAFSGGDQGLARVVNISDHGLMLSTRIDVGLGDEVSVDLSETCSLTGRVVWRNLDQCGLRLTKAIDCAALLTRLRVQQCQPGSRQLRIAIDKKVLVTSEVGMQVARLRDVSQRGAKIVHDGRFKPGLAVKIQIAPGIDCRGVVRWSLDGLAGLEFEKALSVHDLGSVKYLLDPHS